MPTGFPNQALSIVLHGRALLARPVAAVFACAWVLGLGVLVYAACHGSARAAVLIERDAEPVESEFCIDDTRSIESHDAVAVLPDSFLAGVPESRRVIRTCRVEVRHERLGQTHLTAHPP